MSGVRTSSSSSGHILRSQCPDRLRSALRSSRTSPQGGTRKEEEEEVHLHSVALLTETEHTAVLLSVHTFFTFRDFPGRSKVQKYAHFTLTVGSVSQVHLHQVDEDERESDRVTCRKYDRREMLE